MTDPKHTSHPQQHLVSQTGTSERASAVGDKIPSITPAHEDVAGDDEGDQPEAASQGPRFIPTNLRYSIIFVAILLVFVVSEVVLRVCNGALPVIGWGTLCGLLAAAAAAAALTLLIYLVPAKRVAVVISLVIMFVFVALTLVEVCVKSYFGNYFLVSYMLSMAVDVAGHFGGTMGEVIVANLPVIIALVAFLAVVGVLLFLLSKPRSTQRLASYVGYKHSPTAPRLFEEEPEARHVRKVRVRPWLPLVVILLGAFGLDLVACRVSSGWASLQSNFSANEAVSSLGLGNTFCLEAYYNIFGYPDVELTVDEPSGGTPSEVTDPDTNPDTNPDTGDEEGGEDEPEPVVYEPNVLNIDFDALSASAYNDTIRSMDAYFSSQTPTMKNEYTGLFAGKNLIMICAEAFSYAVIDPSLTPALYQLTHTGFVVENFYQPDWTQSTTGGEFALMSGIIPTWVNGNTAFYASRNNAMVFGLGSIFRSLGYTSTAYHANSYTYYNRDETHPNMGYDYYGLGNGLNVDYVAWPASDLDTVKATLPDKIQSYLNDGTLFNLYYMSVSGHSGYTFDSNYMARKNEEAVADLPYSEYVKAYIAAQLELEYALQYLLSALGDADMLDDTVIVMCADHFPYALTDNYDADYYQELTGIQDDVYDISRYYNTLILWSGCIEEPIIVDTPCTAVDVVPTLLNLFGIDYDSRLLSGRDILAADVEVGEVDSSMNIAVIYNSTYGISWITRAGTYDSKTGVFTVADGVTLADEEAYVQGVSSIVSNRYTYAQQIIAQNYYAHVFPNWVMGKSLVDSL